MLCEVGHCLSFHVEATWLSDVMGPCLVIELDDLIKIHEYFSCSLWYDWLLFILVMLLLNDWVVVNHGLKYVGICITCSDSKYICLVDITCLDLH